MCRTYVCPWSAYNAKVKDIEHFRGEEIGTGQAGCVEIQTVAEYRLSDCFCVEGGVVDGDVAGVTCSGTACQEVCDQVGLRSACVITVRELQAMAMLEAVHSG